MWLSQAGGPADLKGEPRQAGRLSMWGNWQLACQFYFLAYKHSPEKCLVGHGHKESCGPPAGIVTPSEGQRATAAGVSGM